MHEARHDLESSTGERTCASRPQQLQGSQKYRKKLCLHHRFCSSMTLAPHHMQSSACMHSRAKVQGSRLQERCCAALLMLKRMTHSLKNRLS